MGVEELDEDEAEKEKDDEAEEEDELDKELEEELEADYEDEDEERVFVEDFDESDDDIEDFGQDEMVTSSEDSSDEEEKPKMGAVPKNLKGKKRSLKPTIEIE